jgi:hypothetical protein
MTSLTARANAQRQYERKIEKAIKDSITLGIAPSDEMDKVMYAGSRSDAAFFEENPDRHFRVRTATREEVVELNAVHELKFGTKKDLGEHDCAHYYAAVKNLGPGLRLVAFFTPPGFLQQEYISNEHNAKTIFEEFHIPPKFMFESPTTKEPN